MQHHGIDGLFVEDDSRVEASLLVQTWCKFGANSIRTDRGILLWVPVGSRLGLNLQVF